MGTLNYTDRYSQLINNPMIKNALPHQCCNFIANVTQFWHVYVLWLGVYWWKRDVRALHDVTSDMSQHVTSERYTTWHQICPKTWCQSVTRRDVRYVSKRDVRALHDVTSDMCQNMMSERYTTWRQICPTKDKISLHGSFTRMRILPGAYCNTRTRIRFDASGYFSSSAIPLCVSGHVSFAIW